MPGEYWDCIWEVCDFLERKEIEKDYFVKRIL